jgi:hypothetical protein
LGQSPENYIITDSVDDSSRDDEIHKVEAMADKIEDVDKMDELSETDRVNKVNSISMQSSAITNVTDLAEKRKRSSSFEICEKESVTASAENGFSEAKKQDVEKPTMENKITTPDQDDMTDRRILKNIVVISLVFFLHHIPYNGLYVLQSSLHKDEGMGVISQAILYVFTALSSLLLPKMVIQIIGHKVQSSKPAILCMFSAFWMA